MMTLKTLVLTYFPRRVLKVVRRIHYLNVLRTFSEEDEPDLKVVRSLVRSGEAVIDVGANIGCYTKLLSKWVGPDGLVVGLEPVPETFDVLRHCAGKTKLRNVQLFNCAASDKEGEMSMTVPFYQEGGGNFYQAKVIAESPSGSPPSSTRECARYDHISVRTLDSFLAGMPKRITFVKCDVEGHELAVIRGSLQLIQQFEPAWLVEVAGDPDSEGTSARRLFEVFSQAMYEPWIFDGMRLKLRRRGDLSVNYFFLQSKHLALVRELIAGS
jgi:FkbM family methyltransferase